MPLDWLAEYARHRTPSHPDLEPGHMNSLAFPVRSVRCQIFGHGLTVDSYSVIESHLLPSLGDALVRP